MKKLSIITTCYNEPNLEKTCESIVNQSWQDFEWIVIDGGSNDETLAIFDKYKSRIDKFVSEPDNGIYDAYNKGIKLATGEYLNFMNAGDFFHHDDVLFYFDHFVKNNRGDVYYGQCELSYQYPNCENNQISYYPKTIQSTFFIFANLNTQGMFIAKALFDKYGPFETKYKISSDYERWLCFLHKGASFVYFPIIVATYDMNGVSANKENHQLTTRENKEIRCHYFDKEKIQRIAEEGIRKMKYTLLHSFFSIRNSPYAVYKIITILGFRIKVKRH